MLRVPDSLAVSISINIDQRRYIRSLFGGDKRSVGKGIRYAISAYRKSGLIYTQKPPKEDVAVTTVTIPEEDFIWLYQNHQNVSAGIYFAIKYIQC